MGCSWGRQGEAVMLCLRCGECCRTMSPITNPYPCHHLVEGEHGICACAIYERRPAQCASHDFPSSVCPIGCDVLNLHDANHLAAREYLMGQKEAR